MNEYAQVNIPVVLRHRGALLDSRALDTGEVVPAGTILDAGAGRALDACASLRADGALPASEQLAILYCAVVGSRAHGLAVDDSDVDLRGFFVAGDSIEYSLRGAPAQLVHDADQLCFWEIGKFLRLALKANPTVLEALYSPIVQIVAPAVVDDLERFRRAGTFLSRRAHQTFKGYAESQFQKMSRSLGQGRTVKWQHAMHLIRLLRVGVHLLETGSINLVVPDEDREELLAIKRGERDWQAVMGLRDSLVRRFDDAATGSPLPEHPDESKVNRWLISIRRRVSEGLS